MDDPSVIRNFREARLAEAACYEQRDEETLTLVEDAPHTSEEQVQCVQEIVEAVMDTEVSVDAFKPAKEGDEQACMGEPTIALEFLRTSSSFEKQIIAWKLLNSRADTPCLPGVKRASSLPSMIRSARGSKKCSSVCVSPRRSPKTSSTPNLHG